MSRRIDEFGRVIVDVSISIPRLGIPGVRDNRIRLDKPAQRCVVPPRPVVIQSQRCLISLSGETIAARGRPRGVAVLAPRLVAHFGRFATAAVRHHRGAAQLVGEQVGQRAALAHGDPQRPGVIIAGGRAAAPLVVVADVGGGDPTRRALHAIAVPIVDEGRRGRPTHPGQAVFGVPSLRSGQATVRV